MKPEKKTSVFDSPATQKKFRTIFYLSLCLLLIIDLSAWLMADRHGHFPWEEVPFFNAVYGFTACVALIFIAKLLRFLVKRKEDYYD